MSNGGISGVTWVSSAAQSNSTAFQDNQPVNPIMPSSSTKIGLGRQSVQDPCEGAPAPPSSVLLSAETVVGRSSGASLGSLCSGGSAVDMLLLLVADGFALKARSCRTPVRVGCGSNDRARGDGGPVQAGKRKGTARTGH